METIDPGYGWEIHPQGDEYYAGRGPNVWVDRRNLHPSVNIVNMKFRRRIDPGEGWEIVPEEEVKACKGYNRGDSLWQIYSSGKWWTSYEVDVRAVSTYRRRKSPATQPTAQPSCQWVKTSERMPKKGWFGLVLSADGQYALIRFWNVWEDTKTAEILDTPRQWFDAPEPPKPEPVDEACAAWESIKGTIFMNREDLFKTGFNLGQQSNKGENK